MSASEQDSQGPVIRDRRKIDPVTGQPRQPEGSGDQAASTRAAGQQRPGKHSVSKPGSPRKEAAGAGAGPAAQASAPDQDEAAPGGASASASSNASTNSNNETKTGTEVAEVAAKLAERTADLQRLQAEYANYRKRVERDRVAVREQALASVVAELLPVLDNIGRAREHEELTGGFKAIAEALESTVSKLGLTTFGEQGEPFDPNVHEALMHSYSPDVTEPTCVQILQPGYKVGERILRPARVAVAEPTDPSGARTVSQDEGEDSETAAEAEADVLEGEIVEDETAPAPEDAG
ncbi:MAG TPA: nucleotide exchange factor GrpE [Streptosporangiaceae bacterium]|nr:nucleotide exchange factor GrpE [Streptosporangiaceae bacterium]